MAGKPAPKGRPDESSTGQPEQPEEVVEVRSAQQRADEKAQLDNLGAVGHVSANYDAAQIQVLEGLEAVRRNVPMYIGGTDTKGLHHLFTEVSDNAVDEALAGYCTRIDVILHKDESISVR